MKENTIEIKVELVGYDELLEKLNNIKKLLQEIDSTKIKSEKEIWTLDDLRQKLINDMYHRSFYEQTDVEILKILFENEKY